MDKKRLIIISSIALIAAFIIPLFICPHCDCWRAKLDVAFTAMGSVAGVITLYIAISLYQKFGLESRFIEKQANEVLQLVNLLKGKSIQIQGRNFVFFLRFNKLDEKIKREKFYIELKDKTLLFDPDEVQKFDKPLYEIKKSYWLPAKIKEKLTALLFLGFGPPEEDVMDKEVFAKAHYKKGKVKWEDSNSKMISFDHITVSEYIKRKDELILEIESWLKKHCGIELDLRIQEPNPGEN